MHYYQFNIADYRKDTTHLTPIEHYIYRQLIDWYYLDESPIPKNNPGVLRRLSLDSDHLVSLENVLSDFFDETENGWEHKRIEQEIARYNEIQERNRKNGAKGGRPKKQQLEEDKNPDKTQSVSSGFPDKSDRKGNQEPITNNQEPEEKNLVEDSDESTDDEKSKPKWTEEDRNLASYMLEKVRDVAPSSKGSRRWPDDIRLMRERDGHAHTQIREMFDWANRDEFWKANILSPAKLREKWAQLEAQRSRSNKQGKHSGFEKQDYSAGIGDDGRF